MFKRYVHIEKKDGETVFHLENKIETDPKKASSSDGQYFPNDALATFGYIKHHMGHALGELLTFIDAAIAEPRQNKAFKDVIKNTFAAKYEVFAGDLIDQTAADKAATKASENGTMVTVSQDEMLGLE